MVNEIHYICHIEYNRKNVLKNIENEFSKNLEDISIGLVIHLSNN
jgi:hypothetical protein